MNKLALILLLMYSCKGHGQKTKTPHEYLNKVDVSAEIYNSDSLGVTKVLQHLLLNHQECFQNKEYFDSTEIIVDTIIYDSSLRKIALFVISKNPIHRNPYSQSKKLYYFNANVYLGKRVFSDSNYFELKCLGPFSEVNFEDYETVVAALKQDFFVELVTLLDENNKRHFDHNLDDVRFWSSNTGWMRTFSK